MQASVVATRGPRALVVGAVITAFLLTGAVVTTTLGGTHDARWPAWISYDAIPEGVSLHDAAGRAVILVRDDEHVDAFLPGIGRSDTVVWCPAKDAFVSVLYASTFAADGTKLGGPAERDLNRYRAVPRFSSLVVYTDDVLVGEGHRDTDPRHLQWSEATQSRWSRIDAPCRF